MAKEIVIFKDENMSDFIFRLKFVLIELGIEVTVVESDEECTIYSLSHAELLK